MLTCEGYRMFYGTATVTPVSGFAQMEITGTWLYKPEHDCWYVNGASYTANVVSNIREKEQTKLTIRRIFSDREMEEAGFEV